MGIAHRDGKVILNFGKPIAWIGLDPAEARELADILLRYAALASGADL